MAGHCRRAVIVMFWVIISACGSGSVLAEVVPKNMRENAGLRGAVKSVTTRYYVSGSANSHDIREYNRAGELIREASFNGFNDSASELLYERRFTYEDEGGNTKITVDDGSDEASISYMRYDAEKNQLTFTEVDKPESYTVEQLDAQGYVIEFRTHTDQPLSAPPSFQMIYERDTQGNMTSMRVIDTVNGYQTLTHYQLNRWGFPEIESSVTGELGATLSTDENAANIANRYEYDSHHNWIKQYRYALPESLETLDWSALTSADYNEQIIEYFD